MFSLRAATRLVTAAGVCDGVVKGLRRPDWPDDPWAALRRLALMTLHFTSAPPGRSNSRAQRPALVLTG